MDPFLYKFAVVLFEQPRSTHDPPLTTLLHFMFVLYPIDGVVLTFDLEQTEISK